MHEGLFEENTFYACDLDEYGIVPRGLQFWERLKKCFKINVNTRLGNCLGGSKWGSSKWGGLILRKDFLVEICIEYYRIGTVQQLRNDLCEFVRR